MDLADVLRLITVELAVHSLCQHFAEADDRGQWGPQLMTHLGQELGFELTGP